MKAFADLVDRLAFTQRKDRKLALLVDYFRVTPDPDRGYALAALTGELRLPRASSALLRGLAGDRIDDELFALSHDFVGDLAETVALVWPTPAQVAGELSLREVVERMQALGRADLPGQLAAWLDALPSPARWLLLKLATGGVRVGVTPAMARQALAELGGVAVDEVTAVWHGLEPPYEALFAWLAGGGERPAGPAAAGFRPMVTSRPLEPGELGSLDPAAFLADWKWDGVRVELAVEMGTARLYSRQGDEIGHLFPDLLGEVAFDAVLDGELLVLRNGVVAPFEEVQRRLGRKKPSRAIMADNPAHLRLYDLLAVDGDDLRGLPLSERRRRLEAWYAAVRPMSIDLSPAVDFADWDDLAKTHAAPPVGADGLLLRRLDDAYDTDACWFKWPRAPHRLDAVLLYVERAGSGRSGPLTGCTFGVWRDGDLVPVGKAALDIDDFDGVRLADWVREHAGDRFGPVTQVAAELVLEVAFDAVARAPRRKSGLVLRTPRLIGIRWEAAVENAARIEALEALLAV